MKTQDTVGAFRLGRHSGWSLHDGTFLHPATALARGVPLEQIAPLLGPALQADHRVELQVNVMLLHWGRELVLIDAGCGTAYGETLGFAQERLRAAGFSPADVTAVAFTHLHLDHVAGALDLKTRQLVYPNARYLARREEIEFWQQPAPDLTGTGLPADQITAIAEGMHHALAILGTRLEKFDAGADLFDGFTAVALPGHTPHHTGFLLQDGEAAVLNAGDSLLDARLHVPHPEWQALGDTLPAVAVDTRRRLLARASAENLQLFFAHTAAPGFLTAGAK